jgi:hypothetical protein
VKNEWKYFKKSVVLGLCKMQEINPYNILAHVLDRETFAWLEKTACHIFLLVTPRIP